MELYRTSLFLNLCAACCAITYIPADLNMRLGMGYVFGPTSKQYVALEPIPPCNSSSLIGCKKNVTNTNTQSYTHSVKTRDEYDELLSMVTKVEGGGWGVSVSAGVNAMKNSNTTESSWTYFVGAGTHVVAEQATNLGKLALTGTAKKILQNNSLKFLDLYGKYFISSIVYGGSFMGSVSLTEIHQSSTSDLDVFAKVDVTKAFFSASASADLEKKITSVASTIKTWSSASYRGGGVIPSNTSTPKDIGDMFVKWQANINDNPEPLIVTVSPYLDLEEVQAVVFSQSQEIIDAFSTTVITQTILEQFSKDYGTLNLVFNSIEQAKNWTTTKSSEKLQKQLNDLLVTCNEYKIQYEKATEVDILARQSEIEHGNYSWFRADTFLDEFEAIKESAAPSPPPFVHPEVVSNLGGGSAGSGTTEIDCPSGKVLTSCGIVQYSDSFKAEPYWSVYPKSSMEGCTCYDDGYGSGEDQCYASCVDKSAQTDVKAELIKMKGRFTVPCTNGYKVTGCGMRQYATRRRRRRRTFGGRRRRAFKNEKYPYVYPNSATSCECYNNKLEVDCYAICSKNIDEHKIEKKAGKGTWNVKCTDGRAALGCGFKQQDPGSGAAEEYPNFWPDTWNTCKCNNRYGMTCYAICGGITSGTSDAAIVTTDGMLI